MKNGRLLLAICEKSSNLPAEGKTPNERRFGEPFKGPMISLEQWLNIIRFQREIDQDFINFGKQVLLGIFLVYELIAWGIWKGDILIADLDNLEKLDTLDIYPRRLNAKEVLISQKEMNSFTR